MNSFKIVITILFLYACNTKNPATVDEKTTHEPIKGVTTNIKVQEVHELIKNQCYVCHNPTAKSHDENLAPPLVAVKYRYKKQYDNRNSFIDGLTNFVSEPQKELALMKGALQRFDVMPPLTLEKEQIRAIAGYLYDNKIDEPAWFAEHFSEKHGAD
ncbi:MAG: c-type cytochrome [Cyclobacteriaceae bacterium]